jgi:hypothetical protein
MKLLFNNLFKKGTTYSHSLGPYLMRKQTLVTPIHESEYFLMWSIKEGKIKEMKKKLTNILSIRGIKRREAKSRSRALKNLPQRNLMALLMGLNGRLTLI